MGKEKGIFNSSFKLWNISVIYIADISGKLLYNSDFFIFLLEEYIRDLRRLHPHYVNFKDLLMKPMEIHQYLYNV